MFDTIVKIMLTLAVAGTLIGLLPVSPFPQMIAELGQLPYLGYLNWFFPVGRILGILSLWVTAIGTFYLVSWILRQLDIIGS